MKYVMTPMITVWIYGVHFSKEKLDQHTARIKVLPTNKGRNPNAKTNWCSYQYWGSTKALCIGIRHCTPVTAQTINGALQIDRQWSHVIFWFSSSKPVKLHRNKSVHKCITMIVTYKCKIIVYATALDKGPTPNCPFSELKEH